MPLHQLKESVPLDWVQKIVHGSFAFNNLQIAGADVLPENYQALQGFQLLLQLNNSAEAQRIFDALAEGGIVLCHCKKHFGQRLTGLLLTGLGYRGRLIAMMRILCRFD